MQAVQLVTAILALSAAASAFPGGYGHGGTSHGTSHITYVAGGIGGGGHGGFGGGNDGGYGGDGGHGGDDGHEHYDSNPAYKFEYAVHDPHSGDLKSHSESRHDGTVQGHYEYQDAHGKTHTVHYTADKHNGYKAQVSDGSGKVTHHGYGELDKQNDAGHAAAAGHDGSYSQSVNHGIHKTSGGGGGGYGGGYGGSHGADFGGQGFGGHGHY